MGQKQCHGELNADINICNMGECVAKLEGRESNSASPSDIWRLTLKPGVVGYKGLPIPCAWLKVFVSNPRPDMRKTDGLQYELRVYRDVVRRLVESRVCPNFVRYLASAEKCSFADMLRLVETNGVSPKQFRRSLYYMTCPYKRGKRPVRPPINDEVTRKERADIKRWKIDPEKLKFGMLLTQDRRVVTLHEWLKNDVSIQDYACMMFQITAALRAMELSQFVHNDLHLNNILVELHDTVTNVNYVMDGEHFGLCCTFRILIFDFDRAYVKQLGPNTLVDRHECYPAGFVSGRDLSSVLSLLFKRSTQEQRALLQKAFDVKAESFFKELRGRLTPDFTSFQRGIRKGTYKLLDGTPANLLNVFVKFDCAPVIDSRATMVEAMGVLHKRIKHVCRSEDADFTFVCNADMFRRNGQLA
jgi:hypothetical protein